MGQFRKRLCPMQNRMSLVEQPIRVSQYLIYKQVQRRISRSLSQQQRKFGSIATRRPSRINSLEGQGEKLSVISTRRKVGKWLRRNNSDGLLNRLRLKTVQSTPQQRECAPLCTIPQRPAELNVQLARSEYFVLEKPRRREDIRTFLRQQAFLTYRDELADRKTKVLTPPKKISVGRRTETAPVRKLEYTESKQMVGDKPEQMTPTSTLPIQPSPLSSDSNERQAVTPLKQQIIAQQPVKDQAVLPQPKRQKRYTKRKTSQRKDVLLARGRLTSSTAITKLNAIPACVSPCIGT